MNFLVLLCFFRQHISHTASWLHTQHCTDGRSDKKDSDPTSPRNSSNDQTHQELEKFQHQLSNQDQVGQSPCYLCLALRLRKMDIDCCSDDEDPGV